MLTLRLQDISAAAVDRFQFYIVRVYMTHSCALEFRFGFSWSLGLPFVTNL